MSWQLRLWVRAGGRACVCAQGAHLDSVEACKLGRVVDAVRAVLVVNDMGADLDFAQVHLELEDERLERLHAHHKLVPRLGAQVAVRILRLDHERVDLPRHALIQPAPVDLRGLGVDLARRDLRVERRAVDVRAVHRDLHVAVWARRDRHVAARVRAVGVVNHVRVHRRARIVPRPDVHQHDVAAQAQQRPVLVLAAHGDEGCHTGDAAGQPVPGRDA
eukprot:2026489-Prymnesium_polylepis.1